MNEWSWGLGDIVNSLLHSGLELEWLHEHSEGYYPMIPGMTEGKDGHYRLPEGLDGLYPLTFSLMAKKRI